MNPLAKPLMEVLSAIADDPKYKELYERALVAHAEHAVELYKGMKTDDERLTPILMMIAVQGLEEKQLRALIKELQKKVPPPANPYEIYQAEIYKRMIETQQKQFESKVREAEAQAQKKTFLEKLRGSF